MFSVHDTARKEAARHTNINLKVSIKVIIYNLIIGWGNYISLSL